jgi:hypothetical protein
MVAEFFQGFKPLSTGLFHWSRALIKGILTKAKNRYASKVQLIPSESRRSGDLQI